MFSDHVGIRLEISNRKNSGEKFQIFRNEIIYFPIIYWLKKQLEITKYFELSEMKIQSIKICGSISTLYFLESKKKKNPHNTMLVTRVTVQKTSQHFRSKIQHQFQP